MNILCTVENFLSTPQTDDICFVKNPFGRTLTASETIHYLHKYDPVGILAGVEPLTREVLQEAPALKVISRYGVGIDTIDLAYAKEKGIAVLNTPDAPTDAVSELTVGLTISLLRHITYIDRSIRKSMWERPVGTLVRGKTVGLIGCGRIGTYSAKLFSGFGCNVLGYDPYIIDHPDIKLCSMHELAVNSDILISHAPLTPKTRHLINMDIISLMKDSAVIINTSRGGIINEDDLYDALKKNRIAGAALDCYEQEPYKGNLDDFENVIMTSHIGSNTFETKKIMEKQALENLINHIYGLPDTINDLN